MTDERPTDNPEGFGQPTGASGSTPGGDTGWKTEDDATADTTANRWLNQLQAMIESVATQAAPVARQIGVKAAELTAAAADRAAPAAHKAGDVAADASAKLAVRSREFAEGLRRDLGVSADGDDAPTATAVLDRPVDEIVDDVNRKADDLG
ncbi:MAG: hypothetical protein ACJ76W_03760 [Chloroflexota bacterium]